MFHQEIQGEELETQAYCTAVASKAREEFLRIFNERGEMRECGVSFAVPISQNVSLITEDSVARNLQNLTPIVADVFDESNIGRRVTMSHKYKPGTGRVYFTVSVLPTKEVKCEKLEMCLPFRFHKT